MAAIKALLVGIDNYKNSIPSLGGCVNDLRAIKAYLETDLDIQSENLITLENSQATRSNIIGHFETHFADLGKDDVGIFYFSGHGSSMANPTEFRRHIHDLKLETLVCYDSEATSAKFDIIDKELNYLVWKVTNASKALFVLIMDCCHSGSVDRNADVDDFDVEETRVRAVKGARSFRPFKEFVGYKEYIIEGDKYRVPPPPNYLLLAACDEIEEAKERYFFSIAKSRGIFTYYLISALKEVNGQLNYKSLFERISARIRNLGEKQNPKINPNPLHLKYDFFLRRKPEGNIEPYSLLFDKTINEWIIPKGSLGLFISENELDLAIVKIFLQDKESKLESNDSMAITGRISKIEADRTIIDIDGDKLNVNKSYPVVFEYLPLPCLKVAIAEDSDKEGQILIVNSEKIFKQYSSFEWQSQHKYDYMLHIKDRRFKITRKGIERPVCASLPCALENIRRLSEWLSRISKWESLKSKRSYTKLIPDNAIEITLSEILSTKDGMSRKVEERKIDNFLNQTTTLKYRKANPEEREITGDIIINPILQLGIRNKYKKGNLWVSVLHFGSNFSISNSFLTSDMLEEDGIQYASSYNRLTNDNCSFIFSQVDDSLYEKGINVDIDHYKVIVCTAPIDTDEFNQEGLPYYEEPLPGIKRGAGGTDIVINNMPARYRIFDFSIEVVRE